MGLELAARSTRAAKLLRLVSDAVGHDVPRAIERGGRALTRTDVLQPTLVAVSLAAAHALEERGLFPDVVVGHSLGELTAVAIATALPDEVAIGLAVERGRAMQAAAEVSPGGMCAVRSGSPRALSDAVEAALACGATLAAENAPDERVVSGSTDVIRAVLARLGPLASPLRTVGAWHSPAMASAAAALRPHLALALAGRAHRCRVISAVDVAVLEDSAAMAAALSRGLVEPVRFVEALALAASTGAGRAHVLPPARVMRSLVRRAQVALVLDDAP